MTRALRLVLAAALVLVAGQLAACAGVPEQGPVTPAAPLPARYPLYVWAQPPEQGATPERIVRGFIQAGADFGQDHRIAREYLDATAEWRPDGGVLVIDDSRLVVQELTSSGTPASTPSPSPAPSAAETARPGLGRASRPDDGTLVTVRVTVPVLARVDDRGIYTPVLRANTTESFTTTLVANRGEWRIRSVPPGLLLSTTSFENRYRATPLYFSDPAGKALVPDVRWFPLLDQPSATTALVVAALLKGPVPWLADAVQSGVVPGTTLTALAPVRIDGSTVRIDLSASARDATPQQRVVLQSELLATLQSLETVGLPTVADVVVTQDQARYDVPEVPGPTVQSDPARETTERPQREAGAQGAPLCIAGGDHVGRLANGSMCAPSPGLDALAQPGIRLPATDPSGTVFAVLAGGGTRVLAASAGKPAEVVGRGQALTAPSVDAAGWVWSVPASPGPTIVLGGVNHTPAPVDVRWLVGSQVLSLRVSPEGIRAVVVLRRAGRAQVVVAAIRRDNDGRPLALVPDPLDLLPDATTVVDAGWADAQTVDVLAGRPAADGAPADGKTYAWQVTVGGGPGLAVADPVGPDAVGLAVGGDRVDLFVRTANGKALERALGGWRSIDVLDPTLPG